VQNIPWENFYFYLFIREGMTVCGGFIVAASSGILLQNGEQQAGESPYV